MLAVNMEGGFETKAKLNWTSDVGFLLDLSCADDGITVQMVGVPVPADGTVALSAEHIALNKLEILFKSQVDVDDEPGQLAEAAVRISGDGLEVKAKVEDVETGQLLPFVVTVPLEMEGGAPESGGPVPADTTEDDLDWEDEATFERMMVDLPLPTSEGPKPVDEVELEAEPPKPGGLVALLKALQDMGPEGGEDEAAAPLDDQTLDEASEVGLMSPTEEARGLLQLLLNREDLELEPGATLDPLLRGAARILLAEVPAEDMAASLVNFLVDQEGIVVDVYIDDESLAAILAEW
jgi:hypothetical protein